MLVEGLPAVLPDAAVGETAGVVDALGHGIEVRDSTHEPQLVKELETPVYRPDVVSVWLPSPYQSCEVLAPEDEVFHQTPKNRPHRFAGRKQVSVQGRGGLGHHSLKYAGYLRVCKSMSLTCDSLWFVLNRESARRLPRMSS